MTNVLSKSDQSLTKRPLLPFLIRVIQNLSIAYGESNPRKTHSFRGREKRRGSKAENTYDYYYVTTVVAFSLFSSTPLFRFAGSMYGVVHIEYMEKNDEKYKPCQKMCAWKVSSVSRLVQPRAPTVPSVFVKLKCNSESMCCLLT